MIIGIYIFLQSSFIISATLNSIEKLFTCSTTDNNLYFYTQSSMNNYSFEDEVLTFNNFENSNSFYNCLNKNGQNQPAHNQNLSSSLEIFDFLDRIDYVDNPVELEKLNKYDLNVLRPIDVDKFLNYDETLDKMNVSMTKDYDFFNWKERRENKIEAKNRETKIDKFEKAKLEIRHDIITKKYKGKMKCKLIQFIKKTIPDYCVDFYIKRLTALEESFSSFKIFVFRDHGENNGLTSRECELVKLLKQLHSNFGKKKEFNRETYQSFYIDFNLLLLEDRDIFYGVPTVNSSRINVRYYFYFELMKLYKYIYEMPELLTVADIYSDNLHCGITNILHLINLFAENIGSLKDNKVFILCLINRAFSYSNKYRKDFFYFIKYRINCHKEHSDIDFLFWEIHAGKRASMKKRVKLNDIFTCQKKDYDYFKAVLIIYLYQHFEFLIFYDFKDKVINDFCAFIDKVLLSKDCFACFFDEYLEIIKRQTIGLR